ncbi:MAG: hypothetical protein HQ483_05890 [Rhodospirillales bacterium]|nr:hypothetical protein [Rhodospirillales bacterium]
MKRHSFEAFLLLLAGLIPSGLVLAAENPAPLPAESQIIDSKSKIYTHPVRGFTIAIPPGSQVLERDEENPQISIRSRKGYMVSLQTGPAKPEIPLTEMPLRLEAKYLGPGRPWSRKVDQAHKQIGGLPAIEVHYEGVNSRARIDIIRGARTDHVFIFFAAEREYKSLMHEYDWMLSHFRPGPDDIIIPQVTLSSSSSVFNETGYGYSIRYPVEWTSDVPSRMTVMFSGKEGSPAYSAIVSVQNIAPPGADTAEAAAELALASLIESLQKSVQGLRHIEERPWDYLRDAYQLKGREIILSYNHAGQGFMKRIIVVPRPDQNLAHIWSYTAPIGIFETYAETANRMLMSWKILAANGG